MCSLATLNMPIAQRSRSPPLPLIDAPDCNQFSNIRLALRQGAMCRRETESDANTRPVILLVAQPLLIVAANLSFDVQHAYYERKLSWIQITLIY
jgi:hypothetical protein